MSEDHTLTPAQRAEYLDAVERYGSPVSAILNMSSPEMDQMDDAAFAALINAVVEQNRARRGR